jgi:hypothetical protein
MRSDVRFPGKADVIRLGKFAANAARVEDQFLI